MASSDPAFAETEDETKGELHYRRLTAVIRFAGREGELLRIDPRENETVKLGGQSFPLAADSHAPPSRSAWST